jgi:hypothetical protein
MGRVTKITSETPKSIFVGRFSSTVWAGLRLLNEKGDSYGDDCSEKLIRNGFSIPHQVRKSTELN